LTPLLNEGRNEFLYINKPFEIEAGKWTDSTRAQRATQNK